jgi:peptidoglycan/xylan/chitin deacetylase (PgdA/CDA1 family)
LADIRAHAELALAWALRLTGRLDGPAARPGDSRAVILAYHRVLPRDAIHGFSFLEDLVTPLESFASQMSYLSAHCQVVPPEQLIAWLRDGQALPRRCVSITFDDGYADNYVHAFPILRRHRLPATIFLTTGFVGGQRGLFWWDEICRWRAAGVKSVDVEGLGRRSLATLAQRDQLLAAMKRLPMDEIVRRVRDVSTQLGLGPDPRAAGDFVTWEQVREMQKQGISFGAHTVSHCLLPVESAQRRSVEIRQSRADVERETGRPCTLFCYPNGAVDALTENEARAAGFAAAMATLSRDVLPGADRYRLPRKVLNHRVSPTVFRFRLSSHPERIKQVLRPRLRRSA